MAETLKLTFDEREPLQRMLGAIGKQNGGPTSLERSTGVALHVRGNDVTLEGAEADAALVERLLRQLYALVKAGHVVETTDVGRALEVLRHDADADLRAVFDDVVLNTALAGRGVVPRSLTQKHYVECMRHYDLTFAVGPAGTGKTFLAVAMAMRMLMDKQVRRIVLTRPAVEAGENLGFLPGTLEEKISPYLRPLYDALHDMLDAPKVVRMLEHAVIEIAPLAYMRGRTLNDAFVILDEAQNTTREQMKMLLTRIGRGTRCVVTGDPSQTDLPGGHKSGLIHALRVLRSVPAIAVCTFTELDVMRHPLVQEIVRAYDQDAEQRRRAALAPAGDADANAAVTTHTPEASANNGSQANIQTHRKEG